MGMKFTAIVIGSASAMLVRTQAGVGGYRTYMRDIPDRFETESDDTLMRSLYENYATEGADDNQLPNHHFYVKRADAVACAKEVIATHLGIKEEGEANGFITENFDPLWAKYDVNEEGFLDIDRMPAFLRSL